MYRKLMSRVHFICIVSFLLQNKISLTNAAECIPAGLDEACADCGKCLPGLFCNPNKQCEIDTGTCLSYEWTTDRWKPKCDKDGTFSAIQCKGEYLNGRCFCFNPKGTRIFGWSWWNSTKNMTCACSRREYKLKQDRKDVTLHCLENGNFEELQCDNGLCWCVNSINGKPTQRVYPESLIIYLPCYDKKSVGSQYLRQCESKSLVRAKILENLKYHGHTYFDLDNVFCDSDGSYSHYQIDRNIVRCTWKDGKQIENYQTMVNNLKSINCRCARDTIIYAETNREFRLLCQPNGNYDPLQSINGFSFCVDKDGFNTTDLSSVEMNLICKE